MMEQENFNTIYEDIFPFWHDISESERQAFCTHSKAMRYPKGTIVHDSTECSGVFCVRSGELRVYILSETGKEITLYRLHKGQMCMLSASCVLQAITFDIFVEAEEDCECYIINGIEFAAITERNPAVKIFALETAVSRFSDVMWVMQQILFMSMDRRLAIFLSDEAARLQTDVIPLTHEQIAKYTGTAREVVSRMLKYFASEGIVEVSRKGVKILNKVRLRELTR